MVAINIKTQYILKFLIKYIVGIIIGLLLLYSLFLSSSSRYFILCILLLLSSILMSNIITLITNKRKYNKFILYSLLLLFSSVIIIYHKTAPSYKDLENDGKLLVNQIRHYKLEHGEYPSSLNSANIINKSYRYGEWDYTRLNNGNNFILSIGDYGKDSFSLSWNDKDGNWYLDR